MTHRLLLAMLCVLLITTVAPAQTDADLRRLADAYWDARMERYPTSATSRGDYRFNDRLEDLSAAGEQRWKKTLEGLRDEVKALDAGGLSKDDTLTRDLLIRQIEDDLVRLECRLRLLPLDPLLGAHLRLPLLLVSHPFRDEADHRAYVARLRAFSRQVDDLIANMREGMAAGVVSPCVTTRKVVPQLRGLIVDDPAASELAKPVLTRGKLSESVHESLREEVLGAIRGDVLPAYQRLLAFIEKEYLPVCREAVGIGAVPGGADIYRRLAYLNTTLPLEADAIHEIGLTEVQRIRREMANVQRRVGFEGSLDDFLEHMRTDPRHRFETGEELFAAADKILNWSKPRMAQLFTRLPKADCVMNEIEPFRAPASPVAYYNPPPEDGSRPGYYYINTYKPEERLRFTLEALSYHEAVPGHHFQIALDQENQALPRFRRYASYTVYIEGWALYTEKLGYEIGGYQDPYSAFGQLTFEMWRACRLVVDTGMHAKGWSRQRAIDFMAANTSLAAIDIENEIDRYITWPGQALGYKIGELRILAIRRDAEERLGPKFDLRAFHDALLSGGAMPIDVLERRMRRWMNAQLTG